MSVRALAVPADHPAYTGHFPGRPILPAVVLLGEALAEVVARTGIAEEAWTLQQAKFVRGVTPGQALAVACEAGPDGAQRFEIHAGEELVASGRFTPSRP